MEKPEQKDKNQTEKQHPVAGQSETKSSAGKSAQQSISTHWHGVPEVQYQYF